MTLTNPETATTLRRRYIMSTVLGLLAVIWTPAALLIPYFSDLVRSGGLAGIVVLVIGQLLLSIGAIILAHTLPENWPSLVLGYGSLIVAASLLLVGFANGLLPNPFDTGQTIPLHCTQNNTNLTCNQ